MKLFRWFQRIQQTRRERKALIKLRHDLTLAIAPSIVAASGNSTLSATATTVFVNKVLTDLIRL